MTIFNKDYNQGFNDGVKHGAKMSREKVAKEFIDRLNKLKNEKGIGPKTWEKILDALSVKEGSDGDAN